VAVAVSVSVLKRRDEMRCEAVGDESRLEEKSIDFRFTSHLFIEDSRQVNVSRSKQSSMQQNALQLRLLLLANRNSHSYSHYTPVQVEDEAELTYIPV
jgi:hypothetical protein